ncbi:MAG: hypothetical protein QXY39_06370 [Thermofilaceae archaeon]
MKKALALVALLGTLAWAGPFVGLRMEWGWPGLTFGFDFDNGCGYFVKYTPELRGWWAVGFTGYLDLPFFANFQLGAGPRGSVHFGDAWRLDAWHWGFVIEGAWKYEAARVFVGLYTYTATNGTSGGSGSGPTSAAWPFAGNTGLYAGINVDIWKLGAMLSEKPAE